MEDGYLAKGDYEHCTNIKNVLEENNFPNLLEIVGCNFDNVIYPYDWRYTKGEKD